MKVRISGNAIRFRLKQSEVQTFRETKQISEVTAFGPYAEDRLSFVLKASDASGFSITFLSNTVTVEVPPHLCSEWTETALVGFAETVDTGKGEAIKILVEKDFACLDGSAAENEDSYPNPNLHC